MPSISIQSGQLQDNLNNQFTSFATHSIIKRLWEKDHTVWRSEEVHKKSILNRLGWLTSIDLMKENADSLISFADEIKTAGFKHIVVLGMGGSSLCPDVCRATFGSVTGFPRLLVLDSTNPTSVLRIERQIDLAATIFIVASKSGGTTETNMFYQYFYDRVGSVKRNPGENFIAVTDANTKMESIAKEKQFRKIFLNPEDIGGRYSALSYFGLVPMALIGMDIKKMLASADEMRKQSKFETVQNPAAQIGLLMGEAHNEGVDKVTFIMSPEISTFAYWVEQLVAESTGKEGKGILPIEGEILPDRFDANQFGADRLFVFVILENYSHTYSALQKELANRGIPYATIILKDVYELGSQFFLWEFATAISAVVLKINPFDEPNVKESKDNTVRVIEEFKKNGKLPANNNIFTDSVLNVFAEPAYASNLPVSSVSHILKRHFTGKKGEDYIALLAYIDQNTLNEKLLYSLREELVKVFGIPVTVGFGPRYLHSTGQLHKGGKSNGIFLLITADEPDDLTIPGEVFSFETLKNAQALGDYRSFASRDARLLHVHISGPIDIGLKRISWEILH
ncbi:MAG: glucose-6-phosphate isomerase [Ignavibacteriales bacterium]|nr:glucose-6-phosphate isomerase [Ignavibacteriales bacterium]